MRLTKRQLKRIIREEYSRIITESSHRLPDLPSGVSSTSSFHFWKQLSSMASSDPEGLIALLKEKGQLDTKRSDAEYLEAQRDMARQQEEWRSYSREDDPYLEGGIVNRDYFHRKRKKS